MSGGCSFIATSSCASRIIAYHTSKGFNRVATIILGLTAILKREIWWTAAADSMRESFIQSNHHIFISKPEDWIQVARRHLSQHGLGALLSATSLDANGGIELKFRTAFHPALSGGVLLGCWERAYGRNGRLECDFSAQAVALRIRPSRAIAD